MKLEFKVSGMTCAACSARVEKVTKQVQGVLQADVNLLAGTMTVEANDDSVVPAIVAAVSHSGYTAVAAVKASRQKAALPTMERDSIKTRIILSFVFLLTLMYFTMGHMIGLPMPQWYHGQNNALTAALLQFVLTLPVVYLNRTYYVKGFKALVHRAPNMDSLIAVGSCASLIYGIFALFRMSYALGNGQMEIVEHYSSNLYFESAAMILTLITLGKFLEGENR